MQCYQLFLNIYACTAFCCRTEHDPYFACVHLIEKFLLLFCGIIVMDKRYLICGYSPFNELFLDIIIDVELFRGHILCGGHLQFFK